MCSVVAVACGCKSAKLMDKYAERKYVFTYNIPLSVLRESGCFRCLISIGEMAVSKYALHTPRIFALHNHLLFVYQTCLHADELIYGVRVCMNIIFQGFLY